MTKEEIKLRQMTGQHLLTTSDKMTVLHDLMGVQALWGHFTQYHLHKGDKHED